MFSSFSTLPPNQQLDLVINNKNDQVVLSQLLPLINFTRTNSEKKTFMMLAAEKAREEKNWRLLKFIVKSVIKKNSYERSNLHRNDAAGFGIVLLTAIEERQHKAVKLLLEAGSCKDCIKQENPYKGQGGLHIAVLNNDVKMRDMLAKYKTYRLLTNIKMMTPAALALHESHWSHLKFFLETRAHAFDDKRTNRAAFFRAVADKQYSIVSELLKIAENPQACINTINNEGSTPLHHVVQVNDTPMLKIFLGYPGCDFSAKNLQGVTPIELAHLLNNRTIIKAVTQYEVEKMYDECLESMRDEIETTSWKTRNFWGTTFVEGTPRHIDNLKYCLKKDINKAQIFSSVEKELQALSPSADVDLTVTIFNARYKAWVSLIREKELDIYQSQFASSYAVPPVTQTYQPAYVPLETFFYHTYPVAQYGSVQPFYTSSFYPAYAYDDEGGMHLSLNPVPVPSAPYYTDQEMTALSEVYTNPLYLTSVPAPEVQLVYEIQPVYTPFKETIRHSRLFGVTSTGGDGLQHEKESQRLLGPSSNRF